MPIASPFSLLRHLRLRTTTTTTTSSSSPHLVLISSKHHQQQQQKNPNKQIPSKNLLKAKTILTKDHSTLAPILSPPPDHETVLSPSQAIGTVAAAQANFMRVIVQKHHHHQQKNQEIEGPFSGVELLCVVKAVLKKIKRRVLVGDKVVVGSVDWVDRRGAIERVFQRRTEVLDPPVANVDHFLVLFSLELPRVEPFSLTRFLVEAESSGIPFTLALNKSELVDLETLKEWNSRLRSWGYEPVFISVESERGLDSLASILKDQTTVIVGPSGVGKSSLINALRNNIPCSDSVDGDNWFDPILGSKWFENQRVGEVSSRSGRGKHTTRNVSLLPLAGGGFLADTPGLDQPSLLKVTKQNLAQAFPEIRRMLADGEPAKCTFKDCLHLGEPGCIVKGDWERYGFYFQLLDEIRIREEFQLRMFGTKKEGEVRYKDGNRGAQQAEPRLEPKKHRRQSRKKINQSLLDELEELDDDDDSLNEEDDPILRALRNENQ